MATSTYYPPTNDGRAHWWQNILANGPGAFSILGYGSGQIEPILADAKWAVYAYDSLRTAFDEFSKAVTAYANLLLDGAPDSSTTPPAQPAFPTPPTTSAAFACGIEKRREKWVQEVKKNSNYTPAIGASLGIEAPVTPFDPNAYVAEISGLSALNPHSVSGKFRKGGGHVESINLYGRKNGAADWSLLGRFSATPFSASVPVSGANPEMWEFRARALARDQEFGLPSLVHSQIVRP